MSKAESKRRGGWLRELIVLVVVAVLVAVVVRTFVAASFFIPSGSMEHTLDIHDRVLVYKLGYDFHAPERGDIVVFKAPQQWAEETGDGGDWIKRVIAVGGDKVTYNDAIGRITVNGKALTEPYIYRNVDGVQDPPSEAPFTVTVPKGRLWLMGDHRSNSSDSREHYLQNHDRYLSTVPVSSVVGRAFATYWPLGRMTWLSKPATYDSIPDARAAN
ncbi:MAG TPA: signal peptidase I [Actinocatenispora sp.]